MNQPIGYPTAQPSSKPSTQPTAQPSMKPSTQPTMQPTSQPVLHPTSIPSSQPTALPSIVLKEIKNDLDFKSLDILKGISIGGKTSYDYSGYSVASVGDFNGDGYADSLVGAPNASPFLRTNAGSVFIVKGSNSPSNILLNSNNQITEIHGAAANDQCGIIVSTAGDFNGDGFSDALF